MQVLLGCAIMPVYIYCALALELCPKEAAKHSESGRILTVELSKALCYHNLFVVFKTCVNMPHNDNQHVQIQNCWDVLSCLFIYIVR